MTMIERTVISLVGIVLISVVQAVVTYWLGVEVKGSPVRVMVFKILYMATGTIIWHLPSPF